MKMYKTNKFLNPSNTLIIVVICLLSNFQSKEIWSFLQIPKSMIWLKQKQAFSFHQKFINLPKNCFYNTENIKY